MDIASEIKGYALKRGAQLAGIAPAERFAEAVPEKRPEALLPGARSVVVVGIRLPDGAVQAIIRRREDGMSHIHGLYGTYGSMIAPNIQLGDIADDVARYIEELTGEPAVATTQGPFQQDSAFSQRRAAVAAGLAEYSFSGYAVTPQYGPRVRFCAVITRAELEPDDMYSGPRLCDPGKCRVCREVCPTKALPDETERVCVAGRKYEYSKKDMNRCRLACYGLIKETATTASIWSDEPICVEHDMDNLTEEYVDSAIRHMPPSLASLQILPNWRCDICLAYCPIGGWEKRLGRVSREGKR